MKLIHCSRSHPALSLCNYRQETTPAERPWTGVKIRTPVPMPPTPHEPGTWDEGCHDDDDDDDNDDHDDDHDDHYDR